MPFYSHENAPWTATHLILDPLVSAAALYLSLTLVMSRRLLQLIPFERSSPVYQLSQEYLEVAVVSREYEREGDWKWIWDSILLSSSFFSSLLFLSSVVLSFMFVWSFY